MKAIHSHSVILKFVIVAVNTPQRISQELMGFQCKLTVLGFVLLDLNLPQLSNTLKAQPNDLYKAINNETKSKCISHSRTILKEH